MADKKKAAKAIFKAGKRLTGDALKRERARRIIAARARADVLNVPVNSLSLQKKFPLKYSYKEIGMA